MKRTNNYNRKKIYNNKASLTCSSCGTGLISNSLCKYGYTYLCSGCAVKYLLNDAEIVSKRKNGEC